MNSIPSLIFPVLATLTGIFLPLSAHAQSPAGEAEPSEAPAETIPWSEIGAKAGEDYEGDGLSITPNGDGAVLNSVFQRLRGEATPDGLWLHSTADEAQDDRFRLVASAYGRASGEATQLPRVGRVETGDKVVSYPRPGLVEEYSTSADGVRQDFLVPERPAGRGELRVELALDGARAEAADFGTRLVLEKSGRQIAYSRLHVVDAEGTQLTARIDVAAADRLVVAVNDAAAKYPVRIDPTFSDWNWVSMGDWVNGNFFRAMASSGGDLYVGGDGIARWDGTEWSALGSGVDGEVRALAVLDGDLYAGGSFTTAGEISADHIARWNGTEWSALGSGVNGGVSALAVLDGDLYAGGDFGSSYYRPNIDRGIARWDGTEWSALGSGVNGVVSALAVLDGDLYAGGEFRTAGEITANNIARWNGTEWSALGSGVEDTAYGRSERVTALAVLDGDLYAGGVFNRAGGITARGIARWDGTEWSALGQRIFPSFPSALVVFDGDLYAAGTDHIARWDGTEWFAVGSGVSGGVRALAFLDDDLYVGGEFTTAGGINVNHIARWDGTEWSALGSGVEDTARSYNARVTALAVFDGDLYVGGEFMTAGGISANHIARWNGTEWSALGSGVSEYPGTVSALAVFGGDLYVGGRFTTAGGISANHIARWDGTEWSALGSGVEYTASGQSARVTALAVFDGDLYAGGVFNNAEGISTRGIARWDGTEWSALGSGIVHTTYGKSAHVTALAVLDGDLYAGGSFTTAGGISTRGIARWDGTEWSALGFGASAGVSALAVFDGDLYVGGEFMTAGGISANNIVRWNGTEWTALGSGVNGPVYAMAVSGYDLFVGGDFGKAGDKPSSYLARTTEVNIPQTISFDAIGSKTVFDAPFTLAATASSGLPVTFEVTSGPASLDGDVITLNGAGTVEVEASQGGNDRYAAAEPVTRTFTVTKVTANVELEAPDVAYDGKPKPATVSTTPSDLQVNITYNGSSTAPSDAGIHEIVATVVDPNYEGSASSSMLIGYTLETSAPQGSITRTLERALYESGDLVSLTATGDLGFYFAGWSGDVPAQSEDSNPLTLTMNGHKSVDASFNENTGGPTDLRTTTDWFYDDITVGTSVVELEAVDPDSGDAFTYALVAGSGDTDNAKFTIDGDELRSAVTFDYDLQKTFSIRVRVTDSGGLSVERAFLFNLVPANPSARFELRGVFPSSPSYVNVAFQLTDPNGRGIDIPSGLFEQDTDIFQVREEGTTISPTESFLQVGKMDDFEDPVVFRTVILLDNSSSVGIDLLEVREAASALVDQILPQQEMAIYSFSSELTELQSFTQDKTALKEAINGMSLGAATTDLNRSISQTLDTWDERFDETGIETGFLVVFTDGVDTTGQVSTQAVLDKRDSENKRIFTIGLGNETDPEGLSEMGNAGSWPIDEFGELEDAFLEVQQNIESLDGSFYWVNYASPRRGDASRSLTISLEGNTYSGSGSVLSAQFSSAGFTDVERGVVVNRSVDRTEGVSSLVIAPDATDVARAFTILPLVEDGAEFSWTLEDASLATLVSLEDDDSRIRIVPDGREGTTNLTVVDTANTSWAEELGLSPTTYTRTIALVIGSEVPAEPDFATWAADAGLTGADAEPDAIPHDDGVSNLLKYAFNMDASRADRSQLVAGGGGTSGLPAVELDPDDPEPVLTIEFLRRRDGSLNYTPEFTSDISDWPAASPSLTVEPIDDQWERVTVRDPDGSSDPDNRFGRVRVSLP